MAIGNYYPVNLTISDNDLFLGTNGNSNNTVNYTAQAVADYLNTNAKVSIGGQLSFRFDTVPGIAKTISFNGGGGDNTPFSSITQLIVSSTDASGADITIFLNYLVNGEILLAQQNQPNNFGNYKITAYTPFAAPYFYALQLQYIGGNGNIMEDKYYDLSPFVLSGGGNIPTKTSDLINDGDDGINPFISALALTPYLLSTVAASTYYPIPTGTTSQYVRGDGSLATFPTTTVPTLNQVLTAGNVSLLDAKIGVLYGYDNNNADYGTLEFYDSGVVMKAAATNEILFYNDGTGSVSFSNGAYNPILNFAGVGNNLYTFQNANGTLAFLSDIPSLAGYVPTSRTLTINGTTYDLTANRSWTVGTVTSVSATSPITSSGGTTPIISTSMATNKLIGRSTAGTGVMEEITVGSGLTLSAGTLSATASGSYVPYTGATGNVDLGTHTLLARDLVINHPSGSGEAVSITKGGSGEALTVVKTSGSGNAASITGGTTLISELNLTTDLADAYIASAATWNAKQDAITLTTTGSSGPATLVGTTLNIPEYAGGGGTTPIDIQLFTSSGVWTKPAGASYVEVYLVSGGGGGGAGRRGATSTARYGGGGGASGAITSAKMNATNLGATENIWIGTGGNGGNATSVDNTNGQTGSNGLASNFGGAGTAVTAKISTSPGIGGAGGSNVSNNGSSSFGSYLFSQLLPAGSYSSGSLGASGFGGSISSFILRALAPGSYGGGLTAANVPNAGQGNRITGGASAQIITTAFGGAVNGGAGNAGSLITNSASNLFYAGGGAGGGSGDVNGTIAGGTGGNGAPGAGGAGGGASTNGANSGAGGRGGDGFCMIVTYF